MDSSSSKRNGTIYACACTIIASTVSFLMGYDTGVMSGAMLFIKEDLHISEFQIELLAGILNYCALIGSLTAGRLSDHIGRQRTIVIASVIFLLGNLLMGVSPNYAVLITGRCIAGVGVGFSLLIAPVYSAEISPPGSRGLLTSLTELCISSGILVGYVSNIAFSKMPLVSGWRWMLGVCSIPAAALSIGALAMPESPRWLVMQGRVEEARKVMVKVSETEEEADQRLDEIKAAAEEEAAAAAPTEGGGGKGKGVWKEMVVHPKPAVKRILVAAVGLHILQHATGIGAIVLYSPRVFQAAGIDSKDKLLYATMGVGITKVIFIMVAMSLLDRLGRRPLLLVSVGGMIFFHTTVAVGLYVVKQSPEKLTWPIALCIAGVLGFVAFYSMGMGPITWVYSSEIYPIRLRAQAASVGVAVNRLANATVAVSFVSLYHAVTISGAFFILAGVSAAAWLFFYFLFPETKGRPLEEIEKVFERGWNWRKDKDEGKRRELFH